LPNGPVCENIHLYRHRNLSEPRWGVKRRFTRFRVACRVGPGVSTFHGPLHRRSSSRSNDSGCRSTRPAKRILRVLRGKRTPAFKLHSSMSIKPDHWIRRMAREYGMIEPYEDAQVRQGTISYGVSSYGYDMRVANEFKIFTNVNNAIVDPKAFDERSFVHFEGDVCIVPPNSFALARSVEYFRIPRNVMTLCVGKSTYARCGIITNVTPFEPEWEGFVTLEISNTTPLPAKVYANEGIAQ